MSIKKEALKAQQLKKPWQICKIRWEVPTGQIHNHCFSS